jgi:hypothetical protein
MAKGKSAGTVGGKSGIKQAGKVTPKLVTPKPAAKGKGSAGRGGC